MLRDVYSSASGMIRQLTGEVFLINRHSHQFTMRVEDRDVTCVATTEGQRTQIDLLNYGDEVFVRGRWRRRPQRDLLEIQAMTGRGGLTITELGGVAPLGCS